MIFHKGRRKKKILKSGTAVRLTAWVFAEFYNNRDAVVALCNAGSDPRLGDSPLTDFRERKNIKEIIRDLGTAAEASKRSQQADVGG